jgi:hypothetical protein
MSTPVRIRPDDSGDQQRLAVLIDADNARASVVGGLLEEVARYGVASVRRIYGDFTTPQQGAWKKVLLKHSIQPVQQFAYTTGKNATDSALIIDAMDLMYTRRFDGFCLVSSDSDFTRLAQRLREEGLTVYGFGERKTPDPFVQACDKFIYVDLLREEAVEKAAAMETAQKLVGGPAERASLQGAEAKSVDAKAGGAKDAPLPSGRTTASTPASSVPVVRSIQPAPIKLIRQAIDEGSDDAGWAHLGSVGQYLSKIRPDFDARIYGHKKLSDLIKAEAKHFEVEERGSPDNNSKAIYVRAKA